MTKIEWAHAGLGRGETWNPIRARNRLTGAIGWHCEKVSPACTHCYAERQNVAGARGGTRLPYKPGIRQKRDIEVYLDEAPLFAPLHWKAPRGIFACSMTDVFGDWVLEEWLDRIFAVAALCPQHIFIFLTKRSPRGRQYLANQPITRRRWEDAIRKMGVEHISPPPILPNVWLGVTAEDQQRAEERIPDLLATPAVVRFVSVEPMLGPVNLSEIDIDGDSAITPLRAWSKEELSEAWGEPVAVGQPALDMVITGGETGAGARPTHIDWERSIRDQCSAAGVAYFRKQVGEWKAVCEMSEEEIDACYFPAPAKYPEAARRERIRSIVMHSDGTIFNDPSAGGAFAQGKGAMQMFRVGKTRAGHLLDGREHHEFPEVKQ